MAKRSRAEIHRERPNEPGMPLKCNKKVPFGVYRPQIQKAISGQGLDILGYRGSRHLLASWVFVYGNVELDDMKSTHRPDSLVLFRKIPSGKAINWLFSKSLPTNIYNQCQLHD